MSTVKELYTTTESAWKAMLEACKGATKSIECEQYVLSANKAGIDLTNVLLEKQKQGVHVRILCDTVGSYSLYISDIPAQLKKVGVDIRFFNPIGPLRIGTMFSWYFRTHRKILIVDSTIGFTGGVGFSEYFRDWRDTHIKLSGPPVIEMQQAFERLWNFTKNHDFVYRFQSLKKEGTLVHYIINAPYFKRRFLYYALIKAVQRAHGHVYITVPYFVPDARMLRALILASRRGVDVRIIVPNISDIAIADIARSSHYNRLLKAGIHIFHYIPTMIHAKTIVVDDLWSSVGSSNFDHLSFTFNYEGNIVSQEPELAQQLKELFLTDLSSSREITASEWGARNLKERLLEILVTPIRRFL